MTHHVLVVEDDPNIRDVLEAALEDEGYAVRSASDGQEAIKVLRDWPADLILLDLMLPVLDGWGFLAARRAQRLAEQTPVIILSASRALKNSDLIRAGATAIIAKPFSLNELLDAVEHLLGEGVA